jgi:hypothetical protein
MFLFELENWIETLLQKNTNNLQKNTIFITSFKSLDTHRGSETMKATLINNTLATSTDSINMSKMLLNKEYTKQNKV